jgi:hypothetical protein
MKKVKIIVRSKLIYKGSGAYGVYYKIRGTKLGVKIFADQCGHSDIQDLKDSCEWENTLQELHHLRKLSRATKLVPKPKDIVVIKEGRGAKTTYTCGYMMEHIKGNTIGDLEDKGVGISSRDSMIYDICCDKLTYDGVHRTDVHDYNVMMTSNKRRRRIVFIDADGLDLIKEPRDW